MARIPLSVKPSILRLVRNVKISHIHRPRSLLLSVSVGNDGCSYIIAVDGCFRLWMVELLWGKSHDFAFFYINE